MEYYKYLRQYVGNRPIILPGSVVIILNEQNKILLQKRHDGYWGLPGGLMDLGESFEDVAKREVFEETGLAVQNLKLLHVFSGAEHYLKVANGDELYSVTAVYYTKDVSGEIRIDYSESIELHYFSVHDLPDVINAETKIFINRYIEYVSNKKVNLNLAEQELS